MAIERTRIEKHFLLLCEGRDAEGFLIAYLNSAALTFDSRFSNDIQVMDFGGNDDLKNYLLNLKNMDGYEKVKSICVVRDAEKDYSKACVEVERAFLQAGFTAPDCCGKWTRESSCPNVGYMLFPFREAHGTLEDLCLMITKESDDVLMLADTFLSEMETNYERVFPRRHKNKLHVLFSANDSFVTMKLGEAASAGAFNWDSAYMSPLREFLASELL